MVVGDGGGDAEATPKWDPACKVADDDLKAAGAAFRAVACAADLVIAASSRPALKVWQVAQAKLTELAKLTHGAVGSSCVEVSGNGQLLLSCSDDGAISLWDLRERKRAGALEASIPTAWTAKFLMDGYRVASGGPSGAICLWDLRQSRLESEIAASLPGKDEPDAKRAKRDKGARGRPDLLRRQAVGIYSLALSADGRLLGCGRGSGEVSIMRLEDQQWVGSVSAHQAEAASPVRALSFDAASRLLLSGGDDSHVCLLDAAALARRRQGAASLGAGVPGAKLERFSAHRSWVTSMSVCPEHSRRVVVTTSWDSTVKLWDYRTQRLLRTYSEHSDSVFATAFQPDDGHFFVSAGADAQVALYVVKEPANEAALVPVSAPRDV